MAELLKDLEHMKWIGLTGGIASGKSTVAQLIRSRGFQVVDADLLAREVVEPGSTGLLRVVQEFGPDILKPDGSLNRKLLGERVFERPEQLEKLERILHPLIQNRTAEVRKELVEQGEEVAFYDVPLLYEKKMQPQFNSIVVVSTDLETQKHRMKMRDGLADSEIEKRLKSQIPLSEKEKDANYVIKNSGSISDLEKQVDHLLKRFQSGNA